MEGRNFFLFCCFSEWGLGFFCAWVFFFVVCVCVCFGGFVSFLASFCFFLPHYCVSGIIQKYKSMLSEKISKLS